LRKNLHFDTVLTGFKNKKATSFWRRQHPRLVHTLGRFPGVFHVLYFPVGEDHMRVGHLFVRLTVCFVLCFGAFITIGRQEAPAQKSSSENASGPVAFMVGPNRVMVHQVVVEADPAAHGLTAKAGSQWVVAVIDVTNFGTAPQSLKLSDLQIFPSAGATGVPADLSQGPSAKAGLTDVQADGSVAIPVDSTVRLAAGFAVPEAAEQDSEPGIGYGAERVSVASAIVDKIDVASLAAVTPWTGTQSVIQSVPGDGKLEVTVAGAAKTVAMAGAMTPQADECFGVESSAAITTLSGGSVWVEDDPTSDGDLVWYWDGAKGHLGLLNQVLIEQGFAGYDDDYDGTAYGEWLSAKSEVAKDGEIGLWELCKSADGRWINPPEPTAVPTKTADEIRADYVWVDPRDLSIHPDQFEGDKIALQGEVFNVPPGQSAGMLEFQIWVTPPSGETVAVYVVYFGEISGIYQGSWVTVYGTGGGSVSGTNAFGGTITQPLVRADIIDQ
jgi:hypothetical protein